MTFLAGIALAIGALWSAVQPGVWVHETQMADQGPLAAVRVVTLRLDPGSLEFSLDTATARGGWTVGRIPPPALAAFNAGQFYGGTPWGWLVLNGVERQPPGKGSTAMSFVVERSGAVSLVEQAELSAAREKAWFAFQSYPALLVGSGTVPWELKESGRGVDLDHRDARLALGVLADGAVVVALTRFSGLGSAGETLPWGPTVGEMAEFMRSVGCVRAVLLDGGISSQLALRGSDGTVQHWTNWRSVPLGMVVSPRTRTASAPARLR
jgi:exopolysaccharide biosynthesis protein